MGREGDSRVGCHIYAGVVGADDAGERERLRSEDLAPTEPAARSVMPRLPECVSRKV